MFGNQLSLLKRKARLGHNLGRKPGVLALYGHGNRVLWQICSNRHRRFAVEVTRR